MKKSVIKTLSIQGIGTNVLHIPIIPTLYIEKVTSNANFTTSFI